jgi:hypothetical protein
MATEMTDEISVGMEEMTINSDTDIALYVGAGSDSNPIFDLPHIKTFYYLDSQPKSEYGIQNYVLVENKKKFGIRPYFIKDLDTEMDSYNMKLTSVDSNLRVYSNETHTIYYYTNIAIPELYNQIKKPIENFNILIIAGYHPDSIILDATSKKIHLILYQDTCYGEDDENPNNIINRLHRGEINDRFYKYTLIRQEGGIYETTGEQISFDTWDEFYEFHYNLYDDSDDEYDSDDDSVSNDEYYSNYEDDDEDEDEQDLENPARKDNKNYNDGND